ncbi:cation:proton antiporter [Pseudonocardia sp. MH-G8]|uniref:cation:proton antiporter domain-containing protein n=1 Tax=Pseudonocardia sp. MH-G8 TaxID=1854588 RepID=UPI0013044C61|nr:cation:proton antiporter [Pseudonocardia sp. MH-G8]
MIAAPAVPLETTFLATVAVVLIVGIVVVRLVTRLGQPAVIGEILAGIMLGPSLLGLLPGDLVEVLFPTEIRPYLNSVAQVGLVLFMFVTGWEIDLSWLRRRARTIAATSISAMAVPFGLGVAAAMLLYTHHSVVDGEPVDRLAFSLYLGTALSITAFPVLVRLLTDKGMQHGRLGSLALACAAATDALAWVLLVVVLIIIQSSGPLSLVVTLGGTAAFVLLTVLVTRPLLAAAVRRATRTGAHTTLFLIVSAGVLLCSYVTSLIGLHAIFGAFVFGLVMPRAPVDALRHAVETPMRNICALLLPIFFIVTGLSVDITTLGPSGTTDGILIILVACLGKLLGTMVPARLSGMSWRDSAGLGVLLNTRGLTELIILEIGRQLHVIDQALFTLMTLMALVTTAMATPLLRMLGLVPDQQPFLPASAAAVATPGPTRT